MEQRSVKTWVQLGNILLASYGEDGCMKGYLTVDPEWVGRYGIMYGDIDVYGELG